MVNDAVADDEELYRRIRNLPGYYTVVNGQLRLSSQAFSERNWRISVNRAHLCSHDPHSVQMEDSDAVVSFLVEHVRVLTVQGEGENKTVVVSVINVEPAPLPDNSAHAEIIAKPNYANRTTFRKLCEKLARLYEEGFAQLLIPPVELRG